MGDELYGMAIPNNFGFDAFKYSWFIPANFEILTCRSNRNRTWANVENRFILRVIA